MDGEAKSEDVIQKIIKMQDKFICVRGNREKYVIEGMPLEVHDEKKKTSQEQLDRNELIKNHLSKSSIEYINNLKNEAKYEICGKRIYIVHYPINKDGSFRKHVKGANLEQNIEMFSGVDSDIYLYGHTHETIYNKDTNKFYINPGALGCPGKTNHALYGILDVNNEKIEYKQLSVNYDVQEVIENIKKIAFPAYKNVLKIFYGVDGLV